MSGAKPTKVCQDVYLIGGSGLSHPNDCSVYVIDAGDLVLIDSGAGQSYDKLVQNIRSLGLDPDKLTTVLVTHRHIDHIGALYRFREEYGAQIIAHEADAKAIETGVGTGAEFYGVNYIPCPIDLKITQKHQSFRFGNHDLKTIHIPGHTDGSIAVYMVIDNQRILFGQDIHGPYLPQWGGNPAQARLSLQELIDLKADILCEGHFGVYSPATKVESYIRGYCDSL